jgi:hypothetical protein
MTIPYTLILVSLAFAIFFHRASEFDDEPTWIWSALSLVISAVTIFWLHCGWLGMFLGQLALFVGITIFKMLRKK